MPIAGNIIAQPPRLLNMEGEVFRAFDRKIGYDKGMKSAASPEDGRFVPNRALGQNFLVDEGMICAVVDAARIDGERTLEIGSGTGALTEGLLLRASYLAAVEKDARLVELLAARFGERLTILHADVLDVDLIALMGQAPWHAVGNLPYYATTPIVLRLLSLLPASMTLMVQKEAAERFFAKPGDRVYGPVAVLTRCFCRAETVLAVPKECFSPRPDVESVVVRLERLPGAEDGAEAFLAFLKRAFAMRRKTLGNNLARDARLPAALHYLDLPEDVRAEAVPPEALYQIYRHFQETEGSICPN